MFEVKERFGYSYGEDTPRVYRDEYISGPFATRMDAEQWIENTDPYDEHNLVARYIGGLGNMDLHYEYSMGEVKASKAVQDILPDCANNARLLEWIEEELAGARLYHEFATGADRANIRGYMDGLAREYVALQDLR